MMAERSVSKIFSDILGNVQEMIRAEILLARTGALDEVVRVKPGILLVGSGALAGAFAVLFVLLSAFHALMQILPAWMSALIVAIPMALIAVILLNRGMKVFIPASANTHPVDVPKEIHS